MVNNYKFHHFTSPPIPGVRTRVSCIKLKDANHLAIPRSFCLYVFCCVYKCFSGLAWITDPYSEGRIAFSGVRLCVCVCVCVCLSVCQHGNSWTVRDIITKFSRHHPVVERADKFENGYVGVRGWWFDVSDVLVLINGSTADALWERLCADRRRRRPRSWRRSVNRRVAWRRKRRKMRISRSRTRSWSREPRCRLRWATSHPKCSAFPSRTSTITTLINTYEYQSVKANTHRQRRRDATRQLSRVGVGGVSWALAFSFFIFIWPWHNFETCLLTFFSIS